MSTSDRDWGGYVAIVQEGAALADRDRQRLESCPLCGEPLVYSARRRLLNCPMGHFRVAAGTPRYVIE